MNRCRGSNVTDYCVLQAQSREMGLIYRYAFLPVRSQNFSDARAGEIEMINSVYGSFK